MLSTGCPGLVVYGRRRTGKSTLLRNLAGFLPPAVVPVGISMQDPKAFTTLADLADHLAREIAQALPELAENRGTPKICAASSVSSPTPTSGSADQGKRLLLTLDEYEQIDRKIGTRGISHNLLATVRESIQSAPPRASPGSSPAATEISELAHAPWTSYLVSARTVRCRPSPRPRSPAAPDRAADPLVAVAERRSLTSALRPRLLGTAASTASTPRPAAGRTWSS